MDDTLIFCLDELDSFYNSKRFIWDLELLSGIIVSVYKSLLVGMNIIEGFCGGAKQIVEICEKSAGISFMLLNTNEELVCGLSW